MVRRVATMGEEAVEKGDEAKLRGADPGRGAPEAEICEGLVQDVGVGAGSGRSSGVPDGERVCGRVDDAADAAEDASNSVLGGDEGNGAEENDEGDFSDHFSYSILERNK
ncbi:hypothetical protein L596_026989 [Steinernema carpocapsae]|uniref:Uncharacterized protein n=1 Tax=Steinernema carpocapsae TaxID=34508 RepID=A0A4U5M2Z7_STECR|nr:hypothetical protein L596_026989 [Steinernema carpocapsae]